MAIKNLLIMGYGYSAREFARHLRQREGWSIIGTTRSRDRRNMLIGECPDLRIWPGDELEDIIPEISHLLVSAPPAEEGDPVLTAIGSRLQTECTRLAWVGYLSTTAVYGDHEGAWVDEDTPPAPGTKRGTRRLLAENAWTEFGKSVGARCNIFRLAGIYGPGRGPLEQVRKGRKRRIIRPGQVFNRIHVADIANTLLAAVDNSAASGIFNVCDDLPEGPETVIGYAAELLSVDLPPAVSIEGAQLSALARSFYSESKRVRNCRLKRDLGVQLQYPTYKSGFRSLL